MVSKILKRCWFRRLTVAACISLSYLDRCINNMSLYQLSRIKTEELLALILKPDKDRPPVNSAARALLKHLIDNGFVGKGSLLKYRNRADVSKADLLKLERCFKNA